jgi:dodecin
MIAEVFTLSFQNRPRRDDATSLNRLLLLRLAAKLSRRPVEETQGRTTEGTFGRQRLQGVELVGTSKESWEKAAQAALALASKSLRDLRIAEVVEQDIVINKGKVEAFRTKLKLSFKYEGGS